MAPKLLFRNPVSHTLSWRHERLLRLIHLPRTLFLTEKLKLDLARRPQDGE